MKRIFTISFALLYVGLAFAGKFEGSFTMHSEAAKGSPVQEKPTEVIFTLKGDLVAIEPTSVMPGMPGKVKFIFNSSTQTSTMLMDNNGQKRGIRSSVDPQTLPPHMRDDNAKVTNTTETKMIDGYKCHKVIIESNRSRTEAWVTDQLGLNLSDLAGAFMAGRGPGGGASSGLTVPKGVNGFPIEMTTLDKERKSTTLTHFSNFHKGPVAATAFSTEGYNVMDMPGMMPPTQPGGRPGMQNGGPAVAPGQPGGPGMPPPPPGAPGMQPQPMPAPGGPPQPSR